MGFLIPFGYISIMMSQQPDDSPAKQLFAASWLGYHTFAAFKFTKFVLRGKAKPPHYIPCVMHVALFFGFAWYLRSVRFDLSLLSPRGIFVK